MGERPSLETRLLRADGEAMCRQLERFLPTGRQSAGSKVVPPTAMTVMATAVPEKPKCQGAKA